MCAWMWVCICAYSQMFARYLMLPCCQHTAGPMMGVRPDWCFLSVSLWTSEWRRKVSFLWYCSLLKICFRFSFAAYYKKKYAFEPSCNRCHVRCSSLLFNEVWQKARLSWRNSKKICCFSTSKLVCIFQCWSNSDGSQHFRSSDTMRSCHGRHPGLNYIIFAVFWLSLPISCWWSLTFQEQCFSAHTIDAFKCHQQRLTTITMCHRKCVCSSSLLPSSTVWITHLMLQCGSAKTILHPKVCWSNVFSALVILQYSHQWRGKPQHISSTNNHRKHCFLLWLFT